MRKKPVMASTRFQHHSTGVLERGSFPFDPQLILCGFERPKDGFWGMHLPPPPLAPYFR